jgi:hypothetical protein
MTLKVGLERGPPSVATIVGNGEPRIEPTQQLFILGSQTDFSALPDRGSRFSFPLWKN